MGISRVIYNVVIRSYGIAIRLAAVADRKAKLWVEGRRRLPERMREQLQPGEKRVWIHCSSLGEFEQGRPVMEAIKRHYPSVKIVLSFFSPSGYEVRKDYPGADYVFYLPLDTPENAAVFLDLIQPSLAIFVKYEFWYYYLTVLSDRRIPVLLIAAIFRKEQVFFRWYGRIFRELLGRFEHIFVQDISSLHLLEKVSIRRVGIGGDTRFDRVLEVASRPRLFPDIDKFTGEARILIAGSTWPEDERILATYCEEADELVQMIIAPHEIDEPHLQELERLFEGITVRYSQLSATDALTLTAKQVVIIDNFGMLSSLYRLGFAAFIGGGFERSGIHNILEAAVYGLPVFFGPNYEKFREAGELIARGGAFSVNDAREFEERLEALKLPGALQAAGAAAGNYVKGNAGATQRILDYIAEKRFLTIL